MVKYLIGHGADVNKYNPILDVCENGHENIVKCLIVTLL